MSATLPTIDASVSPLTINRMDEVCDRFEAAWKAGLRPRIEDYLGALLCQSLLVLGFSQMRRTGADSFSSGRNGSKRVATHVLR